MVRPEEIIEGQVYSYARLFIAILPAAVCFLAFSSGYSAFLYTKEDFSLGLSYEPHILAWIAVALLFATVFCTRIVPLLLRRANRIFPIRQVTLEILCGFAFMVGGYFGYRT